MTLTAASRKAYFYSLYYVHNYVVNDKRHCVSVDYQWPWHAEGLRHRSRSCGRPLAHRPPPPRGAAPAVRNTEGRTRYGTALPSEPGRASLSAGKRSCPDIICYLLSGRASLSAALALPSTQYNQYHYRYRYARCMQEKAPHGDGDMCGRTAAPPRHITARRRLPLRHVIPPATAVMCCVTSHRRLRRPCAVRASKLARSARRLNSVRVDHHPHHPE